MALTWATHPGRRVVPSGPRRFRLRPRRVGVVLRHHDFRHDGLETRLNRPSSSTLEVMPVIRRLFDDSHRDLLNERLVIWSGPPPRDFAKHPETLLALAREVEVGHAEAAGGLHQVHGEVEHLARAG